MTGFTVHDFLDLHPRVYHMTSDGAWASVQRHGLLSTSAILDLAGYDDSQRVWLESRRRPESVTVSVDGDRFVLRDQKPLNESKLASCLVDMTVEEWMAMLNRKVFFWPSRQRCEQLLNAKAYRGSWHTIIEIDAARLLDRHEVTVSPINAGAVLYDPPERGQLHVHHDRRRSRYDDYQQASGEDRARGRSGRRLCGA